MINCPCKDCEKKGCGVYHDKCEKYQAFKRDSAAEATKKREFYDRKSFRIPKSINLSRCKKWN